jgi:hypothetical protein
MKTSASGLLPKTIYNKRGCKALTERDEKRNARREQANAWRRERGYNEYPRENPDHLTTIV